MQPSEKTFDERGGRASNVRGICPEVKKYLRRQGKGRISPFEEKDGFMLSLWDEPVMLLAEAGEGKGLLRR